MMKFKDHKKTLMKDRKFKESYDELDPIFYMIRQLISYRIRNGLTQAQLAERIGTKQSSISRLESAAQFPSLSFLKSVADALNLKLQVKLTPK